jgi:cell division protein FtsB
MAVSKLKTALITCTLAALLVSAGFARELYNNHQVELEIQRLQDKAHALEAEKLSIGELKEKLASQDFLEEEARLKLGLKKPGETAIVIPETAVHTVGTQPVDSPLQSEAESSAKLWLKYFFK